MWFKENWFKIFIVLVGIWLSIGSIVIIYRLRLLDDIDYNASNASYQTEHLR